MLDTGKLDQITNFPALLTYLEDELGWPINATSFEDLTYDYTPAELGLQADAIGGAIEIKQMRPLTANQPWGIFFLGLPQKTLPVTVLRRILGKLAVKKRASANAADRAAFNKSDLLFIAATGAGSERRLAFAHFHEEPGDAPVLRVLGWDADDTVRKLSSTDATLKRCLEWPERGTSDADWRANWSKAFTLSKGQVVKTSKELAIALAGIAQSIRTRANTLLATETEAGPLRQLHKAFKEALIHDLKPDDFADMYAQTIAYGLLSARISRQSGGLTTDDAAMMAPQTSPFLKEMLGTFLEAGGRKSTGGGNRLDFDELGVSAVIDLLRAADMEAVLEDFGKANPDEDPVIHFYELFLKEYDPALRAKRGVFYTPRPVVGFIVRSVDEVLRTEFYLADGLASTATWGEVIAASIARGDENPITLPAGAKPTDPFVRILDPATGTGTFLVECIDLIQKTMVKKWKAEGKRYAEIRALWNDYVPNHLLPRLTGFELMMAPYAIAHVKLGLKLSETGYTFGSDDRAQIYLTNALEPAQDLDMQLAFMSEALAHEAKAANEAKETRFTVVVGNPPYAGKSGNPSKLNGKLTWIGELIQPYFSVDGTPMGEKNAKWVNNDYVKFLRLAETRILASGTGVLGYITSNSWLDSPTFRGVRASILDSFPQLRIVDCHGNIKKKEKALDGSKDEGVFEIEEGTNITIGSHGGLAGVRHHDLFGTFDSKKRWLADAVLHDVSQTLPIEPPARILARVAGADSGYAEWRPLTAILLTNSVGIVSARDDLVFAFDEAEATGRAQRFSGMGVEEARADFDLGEDARDWKVEWAQRDARRALAGGTTAIPILYRPFDTRYGLYTGTSRGFMCMPRPEVSNHLIPSGLALIAPRQTKAAWDCFASTTPAGHKTVEAYDLNTVFPLWLKASGIDTRTLPNIAPAFANRVAALTGLNWDDCVEGPKQGALAGVIAHKPTQTAMFATRRERGEPGHSFGPRDLFDWIYAVLHSPAYRSRYADYLKSDFARVPLPGSAALFEALVPLGTRLVALHLLDATAAPDLADPKPVRFVGSGEPRVAAKPEFKAGRVHINAGCWFEDVPERAWNFHIGGYQPAQKWLKDRAAKGGKKASDGRVLTPEDLLHYRRMITAMDATIDIMAQIDTVIDQHGGWPAAFRGMTDDGD